MSCEISLAVERTALWSPLNKVDRNLEVAACRPRVRTSLMCLGDQRLSNFVLDTGYGDVEPHTKEVMVPASYQVHLGVRSPHQTQARAVLPAPHARLRCRGRLTSRWRTVAPDWRRCARCQELRASRPNDHRNCVRCRSRGLRWCVSEPCGRPWAWCSSSVSRRRPTDAIPSCWQIFNRPPGKRPLGVVRTCWFGNTTKEADGRRCR
jgi:hypothetical protein